MTTPAKGEERGEAQRARRHQPFQAPKGMHDILPADAPYWEKVRSVLKEVSSYYRFEAIETPILESADLFIRGVGLGTDIVEKEMYTLKTKGGDHLALRPELTASVIRAYIEHGMSRLPQPVKLSYLGPLFRHENPQAGRYRQFHQAGFECIGGESDPVYDAQVITATTRFYEGLRLKGLVVQVNSIGCKKCRHIYRRKLQDFYRREVGGGEGKRGGKKVCRDCEQRLETNVLRLLDCKSPICQPLKERAPSVLDNLCAECRGHFKAVLEFLDDAKIGYTLNPFLVRGLDYYNRTVFEFSVEDGGLSLGGGGRYDYLAELLGGKSIPAVGAAPGIERAIEAMKRQEVLPVRPAPERAFVVHVGDLARRKAFALIEELRKAGIKTSEALGKGSLQAQLKAADREVAPYALIIGQREVYEESVIVRDMKTGVQESIPRSRLVDDLKKRHER